MTRLSIITINLNNAAGLEKTLQSVVGQTYQEFEHIVIDGGSTDGSVGVIEAHHDRISNWIFEPDRGIYHAMNKGIARATGTYCLFLNSGDWLAEPTTLERLFAQNLYADIVAGDVNFYDTQQRNVRWKVPSPDELTARTLMLGTLPHQATLIRRSLFDTFGFYNEQLRIASDWLFFVTALLEHNCTYQHYDGTVAYFNMDGISCNTATESLPRREKLEVLVQKYPRFIADYDRLDAVEKQQQQWLTRREYAVYRFLQRVGVIRLGVWVRRLKRWIIRTFP